MEWLDQHLAWVLVLGRDSMDQSGRLDIPLILKTTRVNLFTNDSNVRVRNYQMTTAFNGFSPFIEVQFPGKKPKEHCFVGSGTIRFGTKPWSQPLGVALLYPSRFQSDGEIERTHLQLVLLQSIRPTRSTSETMVVIVDTKNNAWTPFQLMRMLGLIQV